MIIQIRDSVYLLSDALIQKLEETFPDIEFNADDEQLPCFFDYREMIFKEAQFLGKLQTHYV
jgi:hypothetical protein